MPDAAHQPGKPLGSLAATVLVVCGAICFGLAPLFAKNLVNLGIASVAVVFFRYMAAALLLLPFLQVSPEKRPLTFWAMAAGLSLGLGWIGYVEALKAASVATVGVIYMTYPLFTLAIAWLLLRQRPALRSLVAGLLILLAAALSLHPSLSLPEPQVSLLLAFSAPVSFAVAVAILAGKLGPLRPLQRAAGVMLGAALGLLPLLAFQSAEEIFPAKAMDWGLILGISLVAALVPNVLYAIAAPRIGAARTAMAGSMELPTMFLVGWLAFGEAIEASTFAAGLLILGAIMLTPVVSVSDERP